MLGVTCCIGNLRHAIMKSGRSFLYYIVPVFIAVPYGAHTHLRVLWKHDKEETHVQSVQTHFVQ